MPRFAICSMSRGAYDFEVHREGCSDVQRGYNVADVENWWPVEAAKASDAVAAQVGDFAALDQGYDVDCFRIMPCARGVSPPVSPEG